MLSLGVFGLRILAADSVSITKSILGQATSAAGPLSDIGMGLGSLFLLFVIFIDITSILDGGKFQTKMLWPLAIYLIVCNFRLVSVPTVSFVSTLQSACVSACEGVHGGLVSKMTDGTMDQNSNMYDVFMYMKNKDEGLPDSATEAAQAITKPEDEPDFSGENNVTGADAIQKSGLKKWIGDIATNVGTELRNFWDSTVQRMFNSIVSWGKNAATDAKEWLIYGIPGVLAAIIQYVCLVMKYVFTCFGGVLSGVIIAFGPITWAFAIIPGNSKTIGAWFIRLCQFSLYSPLCALVQAFSTATLSSLTSAGGAGAVLCLLAVLVCELVCLCSIPTLASMIIEGASGSVSLSSGLQTIGSMIGAGGALLSAPFRGINSGYQLLSEYGFVGRGSYDKETNKAQMEATQRLNDLCNHFGCNSGPADDSVSGQNNGGGADA